VCLGAGPSRRSSFRLDSDGFFLRLRGEEQGFSRRSLGSKSLDLKEDLRLAMFRSLFSLRDRCFSVRKSESILLRLVSRNLLVLDPCWRRARFENRRKVFLFVYCE